MIKVTEWRLYEYENQGPTDFWTAEIAPVSTASGVDIRWLTICELDGVQNLEACFTIPLDSHGSLDKAKEIAVDTLATVVRELFADAMGEGVPNIRTARLCDVDGCDNVPQFGGYCHGHQYRQEMTQAEYEKCRKVMMESGRKYLDPDEYMEDDE